DHRARAEHFLLPDQTFVQKATVGLGGNAEVQVAAAGELMTLEEIYDRFQSTHRSSFLAAGHILRVHRGPAIEDEDVRQGPVARLSAIESDALRESLRE